MPDDSTSPTPDAPPPSVEQIPTRPKRGIIRRNWLRLSLVALLLAPFAVFALWSAIALGFSYSSGERVGYVQKLSRKGWLCKTWEGELQMLAMPGTVPSIFAFSIRDDSIAHAIEAAAGKQVALRYEEHRGVPSRCFGETDYYIVGLRVLGAR